MLLLILLLVFIRVIEINHESDTNLRRSDSAVLSAENITTRVRASGISYVDFFKKPSITARAVVVLNLETGDNLFELNTADYWPIASITKLVTSVITRELIGNNEMIKIDEETSNTEGNAGDLRPGEIYSSLDLIKAMLLVSSNDAAEGLARFWGRQKFIEAMNTKARDIGMRNTIFFDPTGLIMTNQSSVNDLVILIKYILAKHEDVFKITRYKQLTINDLAYHRQNVLKNINALVLNPDWIGGKTGYIDESGGNLVSLFKTTASGSFEQQYLIIVLGSDDRFADTLKLWEWTKKVVGS